MKNGTRFAGYKYDKLQLNELPAKIQEDGHDQEDNSEEDGQAADENSSQFTFFSLICHVFTCSSNTDDVDSRNDFQFVIETDVTDEQFEDLKQTFKTFDRNRDGYIDSDDFYHVMKKLGHDWSPDEAKEIFKDICKDRRRHKLNFADFVEVMAQDDDEAFILMKNEDELRTAFHFVDQNSNGFITIEDLKNRFPNDMNDDKAERLIKEADKNGDGKVDFEEFKVMMTKDELGIHLVQSEIETNT